MYGIFQPSNILITIHGHLKLCDFGLAGSMVKYKRAQKVNGQRIVSKFPLDPDTIKTRSCNARHDEFLGNPEFSSDSSNDPELSNIEETCDSTDMNTDDVRWVRRRTICGTSGYRPPEQLLERFVDYSFRSGYDERADWFSLGVCCYTMLTGKRPFPTKKELMRSDSEKKMMRVEDLKMKICTIDKESKNNILNDAEFRCLMFEVNFPQYFETEIDAKKFIEDLLSRNPEDRPRFNEITTNPWISGESFCVDYVLTRPIPGWVKDHAHLQSTNVISPTQVSANDPKGLGDVKTVAQCIKSLCCSCFEKYNLSYAERFKQKWMIIPSQRTSNLFQNWCYISEDAIKIECDAYQQEKTSKKMLTGKRKRNKYFFIPFSKK